MKQIYETAAWDNTKWEKGWNLIRILVCHWPYPRKWGICLIEFNQAQNSRKIWEWGRSENYEFHFFVYFYQEIVNPCPFEVI